MSRRVGRPTREEQTGDRCPRALFLAGERLRMTYPRLRPHLVASLLDIHPATWRRYRVTFADEAISARAAMAVAADARHDLTTS